jgi:hypothetical protein
MKRTLISFLAFAVVLASFSLVYAVEPLDQWELVKKGSDDKTQIFMQGAYAKIQMNGNSGGLWQAIQKKEDGAVGMFGNVWLESADGFAQVGFGNDVGVMLSGNRIRAEIYLERFDKNVSLYFRVLEQKQNASGEWEKFRQITSGALGSWHDDYKVGEAAWMAFARIGSEVWFYTPQNGAIVKCVLLEEFLPIQEPFQVFGWTDTGDGNSVEATIWDVTLF